MKAPRYDELPMEVGPLARMLVAYASGHDDAQALIGEALGRSRWGRRRSSRPSAGWRPAGIETVLLARRMQKWYGDLVGRIRGGDVAPSTASAGIPRPGRARARATAIWTPRAGALGHWVQIEDGRITATSASCPAPGTARPAMHRGRAAPTSRR